MLLALKLVSGFKIENECKTSERSRVGDLNLSPSLLKIDANAGGRRLVGAIAFNKLLSQLIEEA